MKKGEGDAVSKRVKRCAGPGTAARLKPRRRGIEPVGIHGLLGESRHMRNLLSTINRVAHHERCILILGAPGTGKETVARIIHACGSRRERPFISLSGRALTEASERALVDRLSSARGGTVYLDEVAALSPEIQARLAGILQADADCGCRAPGPVEMDFRLMASTSRDLGVMVDEGAFRKDLFRCLATERIQIPPLRDRKDDIPALASHFFELYAVVHNLPSPNIDSRTIERLASLNWSENVRGLEQCIERTLVLTCSDNILPEDIITDVRPA